METGEQQETIAAINDANECGQTAWTWRRYTAEADLLALWVAHLDPAVSPYLVFRSPHYVRLPRSFQAESFSLLAAHGWPGLASLTHVDPSRVCVVSIAAEGFEFIVVCESVAFYNPGAKVAER